MKRFKGCNSLASARSGLLRRILLATKMKKWRRTFFSTKQPLNSLKQVTITMAATTTVTIMITAEPDNDLIKILVEMKTDERSLDV